MFGKKISVVADHRPLLGIFGKGLPPIAVNRLQRYLIRASIFEFELSYRKGTLNVLVDFGSRLPLLEKPSPQDGQEETRCQVNRIDDQSARSKIETETGKDEFLKQLRECLINGWPDPVPNQWKG